MRQISKSIQKDIKGELYHIAKVQASVVASSLKIIGDKIDVLDVAGNIEFCKTRLAVLEFLLHFTTKSLDDQVEGCLDRILDVAGSNVVKIKECPECEEKLNSQGKCDSMCCQKDRS